MMQFSEDIMELMLYILHFVYRIAFGDVQKSAIPNNALLRIAGPWDIIITTIMTDLYIEPSLNLLVTTLI